MLSFKYNRNVYFIVMIMMLVIMIIFSVVSYFSIMNRSLNILKLEGRYISQTLGSIFDETNTVLKHVGKKIVAHNPADLDYIYELFQVMEKKNYTVMSSFSWTSFDWVGPNNLQLVNSLYGVAENPKDMSIREYTWKSRERPWTLQLSKPAIGHPSKQWVIPVGTGVTDKEGNFLGTVVIGIKLANILRYIERPVEYIPTSFVVLDEKFRVVTASQDHLHKLNESYFQDVIADKEKLFALEQDKVTEQLNFEDINYYVYQKMKNYPYTILLGISDIELIQKIYAEISTGLLLIALGTVFLIILVFIYNAWARGLKPQSKPF